MSRVVASVTGTFTPAPGARSISTAARLTGAPVLVTVRFSDGTGIPIIPNTDTRGAPRGMAIRFTLPGGAFTDIIAISRNGLAVGTGEEFLAFLTAVARTAADSPHPNPVEQFLAKHFPGTQVYTGRAALARQLRDPGVLDLRGQRRNPAGGPLPDSPGHGDREPGLPRSIDSRPPCFSCQSS